MDSINPSSENSASHAWHSKTVDTVIADLSTDRDLGLTDETVRKRRAAYGDNRLSQRRQRSALRRFIDQFSNLFIYLLLIAAIVTGALGERLDSGVIFAVVLIIAVIGYVQEGRAERALEAVSGMLPVTADVIRNGHRGEIAAEHIVPGDIVILTAGNRVPADARLIQTKDLSIQEAALTGESVPVMKSLDPVSAKTELADRTCIAFSGTTVASGQATAVVVTIGDATEIGRISGMLSEIEHTQTPLMRRFDAFTRRLSVVILSIAVVTFMIGVLVHGQDWGEMFLAAVSIAVAAIPEGLPALITVTLAIGVERMARRNAIIRRMQAVETLGSVTVICSDKTGTLTRNEMTATIVQTADQGIHVEGVGYHPSGAFLASGHHLEIEKCPVALEIIRAGLLCNDAALRFENEQWLPFGDPTEAALVTLALKAELDPQKERNDHKRLDLIPFSSDRRYMATLHEDRAGERRILVKGAPERVLEMCRFQQHEDRFDELNLDIWRERIAEIAGRGQRLLAVATKHVPQSKGQIHQEDVEEDLVFLGVFGLIDPPRPEAIQAVSACLDAGIDVKMVTGDHAGTASAIAEDLGLKQAHQVVVGRDVEEMNDDQLQRSIQKVNVFARVSPEHKLRLVRAFQRDQQVTAMTGDGVNDAPALKSADVGIAMGQKGTEAAREAADMVLADDNFATIQRAVEQGRTVDDNIKKAILFMLPTNAAQAAVIVSAVALGTVLPVTPVQILWINMVTAVTLGITFAWEKAEGDVMKRPPRRTDEPLITPFMLWRIGFVGVLLLVGTGALFLLEQTIATTSLDYARTLAVNALVMGQIFYLLTVRFFDRPSYTWNGLTGSRAVVIAIFICLGLQMLITYAPFMNTLFGTEPLDAVGWASCVAVGLIIFIIVELEKYLRRSRRQVLAERYE
jgi:magnesium-transporting ATPase (P-type)